MTVQTFFPYADFERSARSLDRKRLGKQRYTSATSRRSCARNRSITGRCSRTSLMTCRTCGRFGRVAGQSPAYACRVYATPVGLSGVPPLDDVISALTAASNREPTSPE